MGEARPEIIRITRRDSGPGGPYGAYCCIAPADSRTVSESLAAITIRSTAHPFIAINYLPSSEVPVGAMSLTAEERADLIAKSAARGHEIRRYKEPAKCATCGGLYDGVPPCPWCELKEELMK